MQTITFNKEGDLYVGKITSNFTQMTLFIEVNSDNIQLPNINLETSIDGIEYTIRDNIINPKDNLYKKEKGYSGIISGQYIRITSNLPVSKCVILTNAN